MSETLKRGQSGPPAINALLAKYLSRLRTEAALHGLWESPPASEVEPYQPAEVNVLESRTALEEALAAAHWLLDDPTQRTQFQVRPMRHVPEWANLLRRVEPMPFVPFALGYFPQLVRDVHLVWQTDPTQWKPPQAGTTYSGLWEWGELMLAQMRPAEALFAAAVLRLLGQTREARQLLRAIKGQAPASWHLLLLNEDAALAWHEGDYTTAATILESANSEAPPICFNRGLNQLLQGKPHLAREQLARAVAQLPETSAWHHLAQMYRLLAER